MADASLEGWNPEPGVPLTEIIDKAFDYRGNVTVQRVDGTVVVGYVSNRNAVAHEPYLQLFDIDGAGPLVIRYADVRTIRFTGKDPAAGNSYAAWLERKTAAKADGKPAPQR